MNKDSRGFDRPSLPAGKPEARRCQAVCVPTNAMASLFSEEAAAARQP